MPKHQDGAIPTFQFILQPEFPLNALILASETLRIANQNSGRMLFRWLLVSETGDPVRASNGMWLAVDRAIDEADRADVHLVFDGNLPTRAKSAKLLARLRSAARTGAIVGGVDTGVFTLAEAGVATSAAAPEVVLHWEATQTFRERWPDSRLCDQIYVCAANRAHCAGGVATLDMILDLIGRFQGDALADEVANALVHTRRPATAPQRSGAGTASPERALASRLVASMEAHLDFPLPLDQLAEELRTSPRTLTRVCQRAFKEPPMRLYRHVRLQAARNLLFYDDLSIRDVALACGFSYPSVFARAFKQQFHITPRAFRLDLRRKQRSSVRPEINRLIGGQAPGS